MARVKQFELFAVDLPFRMAFKHAAAKRRSSDSVFLKCTLDSGTVGFGECLPRIYVTGETRDNTFEMLSKEILPHLIGKEFRSLDEVNRFLNVCDGKAPSDWVSPQTPHTAAWCAVDLALLDSFSREFKEPLFAPQEYDNFKKTAIYSAVISSEKSVLSLLKMRLFSISQVKLKVESNTDLDTVKRVRRFLGKSCDIRLDANMAWDEAQTLAKMEEFARYNVHSVEQPLPVEQVDDVTKLVNRAKFTVMADESISDRASLEKIIGQKSFTAINARISKCGGLTATLKRCREARNAGLKVQIGCQVGESSLLSAAHLLLSSRFSEAVHLEGCFGLLLLKEDPAIPVLQFGYGGRPPKKPTGNGLGVTFDEDTLRRWTIQSTIIQ